MLEMKRQTAAYLLQSKAIILEPSKPFIWASGWHSPIYCDNRITLSCPEIRTFIKEAFIEIIRTDFGIPDVVAGVATGAIAQGALVAEALGLPMIYVRSAAKGHGRQNLIEGRLEAGQEVVVIEDLVSTGGSSLKAVESIRAAGGRVTGMAAIFTYGFPVAEKAFHEAGVTFRVLSDYHTLVEMAVESGYIDPASVELLSRWREDPAGWTGA
jgi:orotate phosphoribosyltransferase